MSAIQYLEPFPNLLTSQVGECILMFLKACGAQPLVEIYREVRNQVVGIDTSNCIEVTDGAIAILLDNHLIEKWEYEGERDDSMIDYYDLPEDDDESA